MLNSVPKITKSHLNGLTTNQNCEAKLEADFQAAETGVCNCNKIMQMHEKISFFGFRRFLAAFFAQSVRH